MMGGEGERRRGERDGRKDRETGGRTGRREEGEGEGEGNYTWNDSFITSYGYVCSPDGIFIKC